MLRSLVTLLSLLLVATSQTLGSETTKCKCFPGDSCWPNADEWQTLNKTVGGRLISTVPLGSPCHDPTYDTEKCQDLRDKWLYPGIHMESSSSVMAPIFANQSCDPWQPREKPCTLGNYVSYSVAISGPEDAVAAFQFAEEKNIRIVIRNTGHDYLGRSTGAGALAIWTHYLKSTEILDWKDSYYQGKALKVGAGVQGFEALAAVKGAGLVVVTGECPTVGLAGGYIQAGGHSALSTNFGLAADNTLSFEVVTPSRDVLTASSTENQDLFWALSGGGGGNFGLVTSVTVKAHPDNTVAGASFQVNATKENLFLVIDAFHKALPDIVSAGVMVIYFFSKDFFRVPALTAYGKNKEQVGQILRPFYVDLITLGFAFEPGYTEFQSYHDHFDHYWGPLPEGNIQVGTQLFGGRLITRSALANFSSATRQIAEEDVVFIGVGTDVSAFGKQPHNAVLPQWRDSIISASLTLPWSFQVPLQEMVEMQLKITKVVQPKVELATPGSGTYINEADFLQPNWQETFFGANYPELLSIKKKYDPKDLLNVRVGVGSEMYDVNPNGRVCRIGELRTNL